MLKSILGIVVLGSIVSNTFASVPEQTQYINEDGTISVSRPQFNEDGQYISLNSNKDGVCALLGLGKSVLYGNYGLMISHPSGKSVRVNSSSEFDGYESSHEKSTLAMIACESDTKINVSENYDEIKENYDGSTTIIGPKFHMHGRNTRVSHKSDLNGVCKLYGYSSYVPNSLDIGYDVGNYLPTIVNSSSMFSGVHDTHSMHMEVLGSLICK